MKSRLAATCKPSPVTKPTEAGFRIHEQGDDMPHLPVARFTRGPDETAIYAFACRFPADDSIARVHVSRDGGATWSATEPFDPSGSLRPSDSGAFIKTRRGTLIAAFSNGAERAHWNWDATIFG